MTKMRDFVAILLSLLKRVLASVAVSRQPSAPAPVITSKEAAQRVSEIHGLDAIKLFEGLRLRAYLCSANVWTIGYGHTKNVREGMTITNDEADAFLIEDIAWVLGVVERSVKVELSNGQRGAINSLIFNIGGTAFRNSTLLRKLNAGDYAGAADEFPKWKNAGGRVNQGLVNRRLKERTMFLS
jgi:lysozyme